MNHRKPAKSRKRRNRTPPPVEAGTTLNIQKQLEQTGSPSTQKNQQPEIPARQISGHAAGHLVPEVKKSCLRGFVEGLAVIIGHSVAELLVHIVQILSTFF